MGVVWSGGSWDAPKDEMRIYDVQKGIVRSLYVQKWLSASILENLKENGLKLADLNKGSIRLRIQRLSEKEWDVQLVDKHYSEDVAKKDETKTGKMMTI
jgi:hypothetical protein